MKTTNRKHPDFLNGVPELLILRQLANRPMHGYELVQSIRAGSGCAFEFGEGCIYPILHRLERESCLASQRLIFEGRSRVVYRLTEKGKRQLAESVSAWQRVVDTVRLMLEGGLRGQTAHA